MDNHIKKLFLATAIITLIVACKEEKSEIIVEENSSFKFLIGSYTDKETEGIGLMQFDSINKEIFIEVIEKGVKNPSFLITNKDQDILFAVEETAGDEGGKVKSFAFDLEEKTLSLLSTLDTYGDHPCHLTLDPSEKFLVVSNYSGGNFSIFKNDSGVLTHLQTLQHQGNSISKSRQEKPHVHSALFHPNGKHLLVADLGTDKIYLYDFDKEKPEPLQKSDPSSFEIKAGSGPRHFIFNEEGNMLYLVHELTAELGVYSFENGKIHNLETIPLNHPHFDGKVGGAEVKLSDNGKYIYVSNRGDANEISVYEKDLNDKLILIQRTSTKGIAPRNFDFSIDGKYLLVANQDSNEIIVFEMDPKSGLIKEEVNKIAFQKPSYVLQLR
ncbi:lactonase family protein [Belliella sp. DSM 107340]|uniref:Lactonase family protein n=1 Tax=Belliella calami TaxID=2923436 RepID=A0ABS9UK95_9BACT|nr:lactonase family protein [Belliella calami]MCH7397031.1 lactonase family protein [Belliella calami]